MDDAGFKPRSSVTANNHSIHYTMVLWAQDSNIMTRIRRLGGETGIFCFFIYFLTQASPQTTQLLRPPPPPDQDKLWSTFFNQIWKARQEKKIILISIRQERFPSFYILRWKAAKDERRRKMWMKTFPLNLTESTVSYRTEFFTLFKER